MIKKDLPTTFEGTFSHYIPLITICPVSKLPDIGYVTVYTNSFVEIYGMRKIILKHSFSCMFMEDLVLSIKNEIEKDNDCRVNIQYRMLGGRVIIKM